MSSNKILNLAVTGMTCGKCERLITEGAQEVPGVTEVSIDRPNGKVKICMSVENPSELESKKATILSIINSLVNGKFNAVIESGAE